MAYQTGSATSIADLISQLFTFATANGWTQDQLSTGTGQAALHKGNVWVSLAWNTGTPNNLALYQALGFTGGNRPGTHPNDSGNGFNTSASPSDANIATERHVPLTNGPFPHYAFFENDSNPAYIHVVVETSSELFVHFGFGEVVKFDGTDWTGGEYLYGYFKAVDTTPINTLSTHLLDGGFTATGTNARRAATLHIENFPSMVAAQKWGQVSGDDVNTPPADEAGNAKARIIGGYRAGMVARHFGFFSAGSSTGLVPSTPIALWFLDTVGKFIYLLGFMPDVRMANIGFLAPKEEISIGGDVWIVYPSRRKTSISSNDRSYNQGMLYKKVTA